MNPGSGYAGRGLIGQRNRDDSEVKQGSGRVVVNPAEPDSVGKTAARQGPGESDAMNKCDSEESSAVIDAVPAAVPGRGAPTPASVQQAQGGQQQPSAETLLAAFNGGYEAGHKNGHVDGYSDGRQVSVQEYIERHVIAQARRDQQSRVQPSPAEHQAQQRLMRACAEKKYLATEGIARPRRSEARAPVDQARTDPLAPANRLGPTPCPAGGAEAGKLTKEHEGSSQHQR